ncbi:MAG: hypothetical protein KDG50_12360 [Chromatiales bacterium]|nr:hypothetical protein [Chromatiales bacterium]
MNDEQRRMTHFGAQPEGTGPFFRPTLLLLAYVRQVHRAHSALLAKKTAAVAAIGVV